MWWKSLSPPGEVAFTQHPASENHPRVGLTTKNHQVNKNLLEIERKTPRSQEVGPRLEKFNVDTNKTQKTSATGDTTRKQKKHRTKPRITDSYKTRNNLKWKRINELKVKPSSGKEDNKKVEREVPLCFLLLSSFPVQVFYFSSCTLLHSKISREMLRKKLLKKRRNKNKQIDKQEQTTDRKETIKTTHVRERRSVPRVGWEGTNNSV